MPQSSKNLKEIVLPNINKKNSNCTFDMQKKLTIKRNIENYYKAQKDALIGDEVHEYHYLRKDK